MYLNYLVIEESEYSERIDRTKVIIDFMIINVTLILFS